jgi:predicted Fe-Mo cluster-binding NifX family protein
MRIAISTEENQGLESKVAQHFGRCPFYILIDMEDDEVRTVSGIANPHFQSHAPGMVPNFISEQQVNVMISGGMGGRAIQFFQQFGIEVATGAAGTARDALSAYLTGELSGGSSCKESEEHGH